MIESSNEYVNYRIEQSADLFEDAVLLATNKRWRSCVNRLYSSSFHLINALLFKDGITPKSHDGLKTKFLQLYVKTNLILNMENYIQGLLTGGKRVITP